ncbi:MAG: hypothetical protein EZS28_018840 [Streblomastix strix]|uniref:DDE-1 domain-containing protein n=1 Tax=Streblomastix strix TaxID=222440 RepID=A0A5J4VSS7_9EUKA|nr:MAG: hypothetical protein EZS28_018840 [Streblomastix strix]
MLTQDISHQLYPLPEADAFFVFVSKRCFMTKVLFREWCTILINWVLEQKLIGYYAQDEKIILFVDGHPSRRDREVRKLLKKGRYYNIIVSRGTNISYAELQDASF